MIKRLLVLVGISFFASLVFSQENMINVDQINKLYSPYKECSIEFNIVGPKLLVLYNKYKGLETVIGKPSKVFRVLLESDKYHITLSPSLDYYLRENPNRQKEFQDIKSDIEIVLKYFNGFFYGVLLEGDIYYERLNDKILNYIYYYEYKGIKCKNVFTFDDTRLLEMSVFTLDSINPEVTIYYEFERINDHYYLIGFRAKNYRQDFQFNYRFIYSKNNRVIFPEKVIVEVVQNNKSLFMKYLIYECKSLTTASTLQILWHGSCEKISQEPRQALRAGFEG
jgi:hypothetical protein